MELLKALYKIHAPTGKEWPMIQFILDYVSTHIKDASVKLDSWGNLYITKGFSELGFPTLCCHLDQAQKIHSDDFEVRERCVEVQSTCHIEFFGWSESRQSQEGLGADDKNGIWVCLNALRLCKYLKVFMAVGEEKGCWGSNRANIPFFKDSLYILEPDCKGGKEIRTLLKGVPVASKEFEEVLMIGDFRYVFDEGKSTDILPLTLSNVGVSCANIPCGYQNPHKDDEYCIKEDLLRCLNFVLFFVENIHKKFPHEYKTETREIIEKLKLFD